jgi:hypothetical protein
VAAMSCVLADQTIQHRLIGAGSAREERPDLSAFPSFNLERFEYDFRRVSNLDLESF